jgi:hypothetical protein
MSSEKPQEDRVKEIMTILHKFHELGIPLDSPEVGEVKVHFNNYIRDGTCWSGSISFAKYGRIVDVNLPKRADKLVEVTLRLPRAGGRG